MTAPHFIKACVTSHEQRTNRMKQHQPSSKMSIVANLTQEAPFPFMAHSLVCCRNLHESEERRTFSAVHGRMTCMIMPPRWALAGAHFDNHNHQLYAAKINDHTSIQIYSLFWWLPAPSQYMLLEEWVLVGFSFSRMQSYATRLYKENFISIQLWVHQWSKHRQRVWE
jgi:hypothetical protein